MMKALVFVLVACVGALPPSPAGQGGFDRPNHTPTGHHMHIDRPTFPQLQPDLHNNADPARLMNFFEHEIVYVENDMVLNWKPTTGEWALHALSRSCGPDCPIVQERPISKGEWPQHKYHKMIFMGCHATTGHGHMMVIDPASGNYTVELFEHEEADPMTKRLAWHARHDMTLFDMTYMGRDEILLHNGTHYRTYLVEPRLPMSSGEDPVGPWDPIDQGIFPMLEQVIYLGDNHVMDYSPTTGEYHVYLYDRGAIDHERPFSDVMLEGKLEGGLQLTFLGQFEMLVYYPYSGDFKAFHVYDGHVPQNFTGQYYGFGSILSGETCAHRPSCTECLARDGCGWCFTNEECYRGNNLGPCVGNCTHFELHICPGEGCHVHRGCTACLHDPFCGWCADSETCTEGTANGPLFGACDFYKMTCPWHTEDVEKESGCVGQIE